MCLPAILGTVASSIIGKKLSGSSTTSSSTTVVPTQTNVTTGSESLQAGRSAKQKAAAAQGMSSTNVTGGITSQATTSKKTLLGE